MFPLSPAVYARFTRAPDPNLTRQDSHPPNPLHRNGSWRIQPALQAGCGIFALFPDFPCSPVTKPDLAPFPGPEVSAWIVTKGARSARVGQNLTRFLTRVMAAGWLADTNRAFKRHRLGRPGWYLRVHRDRLRLLSAELPPRPGEPAGGPAQRSLTLRTPPCPSTAAAALAEACAVFDAVMESRWSWPGPDDVAEGSPSPLAPANLQKLITSLRDQKVGEVMQQGTWDSTWAGYLAALVDEAAKDQNEPTAAMVARYLRRWPPQTRARQMAHDRARALFKFAGWDWSPVLLAMRGNGKAAADPVGAKAFTDRELSDLRSRILRSKLTAADLVAWDTVIVFGLRPAELKNLELVQQDGALLAVVSHVKRSSRGSSGPRTVPAVPPKDWPQDCFSLYERWREHGFPAWVENKRSPGRVLTRQLRGIGIPSGLSSYGARHAWAIRVSTELGLHVREAAELMGHSPSCHLSAYGRHLDTPALLAKVARLTAGSKRKQMG